MTQTIIPITNDATASYITCCLINSVENTTSIESIVINIFIHLGELALVSNMANINKKEYKQWILGKQFIPGSSRAYIISTSLLEISLVWMFALIIVLGKAIKIIPAISVVIIKVTIYL